MHEPLVGLVKPFIATDLLLLAEFSVTEKPFSFPLIVEPEVIIQFRLVPFMAQLYFFVAPASETTLGAPVVGKSTVAQTVLGNSSRRRVVRIRVIFWIVWRLSKRFVIMAFILAD